MRADSGVILIVIDGCRPDGLQAATTPCIDALITSGSWTPRARSVMPSCTLPCHTSMFRGCTPARHGIVTNVWTPMVRPVPSIVEVAHDAGLTTSFFYNWEELRDLAKPGSLDMSFMSGALEDAGDDMPVVRAAARFIVDTRPDFCFVYLGMVDVVGHRDGWMSPEYIEQIGIADGAVAHLLEALETGGAREGYTIILLSDHGGHEKTHGTDSDEDMTVPWIANGVRVEAGAQLETPVSIIDTAPTIALLLGLEAPRDWEGSAVSEVLRD